MQRFPKLSSGAVAQYPCERIWVRPASRIPFVDGSSKRFALKKPKRRWVVRLEELNEGELAVVSEFHRQHLGEALGFEFEDPWTGDVVAGCHFMRAGLRLRLDGMERGSADLEIEEGD
jgi:hypothetical protein